MASSDGRIRERRPGGSWSPPRALPGAGPTTGLQVAAGRPGTALASYVRSPDHGRTSTLLAQVRGPSRTWSAPHALTRPTTGARFTVRVAGNEDGDYAVVWVRRDVARPQLQVSVRLRGDRWRTTSWGPVVGDFTAAMDAGGSVYVVRGYGTSARPSSFVRRIKRPGRVTGAPVVLPITADDHWTYLVERTGRQTLVTNTGSQARVRRQERLGGPLTTVWSLNDVWVRAAVGGGRLRIVSQPYPESTVASAVTVVLRPRTGQVVPLGRVQVATPFMDARGRGVIVGATDDTVSPGQPVDDVDSTWARSFTDSGLQAPFRVAAEPTAYPEEDLGLWWTGWNATDGHQLLVTYGPDAHLPGQEGGGPPYEDQLWATQVRR